MTPQTLAARLKDLGYDKIDAAVIETFFDSSTQNIEKSRIREGAYVISPAGERYFDRQVGRKIVYDGQETVTFGWVINNVSAYLIITFLMGLFVFLSWVFSVGYKIGYNKNVFLDK